MSASTSAEMPDEPVTADESREELEAHFDEQFDTDNDPVGREAECSSFGPGCVRT